MIERYESWRDGGPILLHRCRDCFRASGPQDDNGFIPATEPLAHRADCVHRTLDEASRAIEASRTARARARALRGDENGRAS